MEFSAILERVPLSDLSGGAREILTYLSGVERKLSKNRKSARMLPAQVMYVSGRKIPDA